MGSQALASPEFRIAFPMAQDPAADAWLRAETERVLLRLLDTLGRERLRASHFTETCREDKLPLQTVPTFLARERPERLKSAL